MKLGTDGLSESAGMVGCVAVSRAWSTEAKASH